MAENIDSIAMRNRKNYPLEELGKLAGKHVAWSRDNAKVLVASADINEVFEELERLGATSEDFILEYIPDGFSA
jgi:hypothetical protein